MLKCKIRPTKTDHHSISVMMLPIKNFPTNEEVNPLLDRPFVAIIGAIQDEMGWSFTCLNAEEKECIAIEMLRLILPTEEWFWCNLYETFV